ncbi:hypothetical protein [Parabacteroides sp. Marseille-P3160]|uniref:hypothetical protein n=1 Tax=Parabacteroides sp. Marseille-P3160 TaxID=1917887 RepID=UPI0009BB2FDE|nr:hypothetical protein [Parabacteroides sp. Marseille-P3160]
MECPSLFPLRQATAEGNLTYRIETQLPPGKRTEKGGGKRLDGGYAYGCEAVRLSIAQPVLVTDGLFMEASGQNLEEYVEKGLLVKEGRGSRTLYHLLQSSE